HRYRTRRRAIAERRRRLAIFGGLAALVVVIGALALRRPASPAPAVPAAQRPSAATLPTQAAGAATPQPESQPAAAAGAPEQPAATAAAGAPAAFFDDRRLTYERGFYGPQIQAFLDTQPGPLKKQQFQVGD